MACAVSHSLRPRGRQRQEGNQQNWIVLGAVGRNYKLPRKVTDAVIGAVFHWHISSRMHHFQKHFGASISDLPPQWAKGANHTGEIIQCKISALQNLSASSWVFLGLGRLLTLFEFLVHLASLNSFSWWWWWWWLFSKTKHSLNLLLLISFSLYWAH